MANADRRLLALSAGLSHTKSIGDDEFIGFCSDGDFTGTGALVPVPLVTSAFYDPTSSYTAASETASVALGDAVAALTGTALQQSAEMTPFSHDKPDTLAFSGPDEDGPKALGEPAPTSA